VVLVECINFICSSIASGEVVSEFSRTVGEMVVKFIEEHVLELKEDDYSP
jgi:hypothetical protein